MERKLKEGHIIIQILVNEDKKEIDELISYANDKECQSYYRSLTDSDEQLKECVIAERVEPYYAFKDKNKSEIIDCCDIDIDTDSLNVINFDSFKHDLKDMEKYYDEHSFQFSNYEGITHYEFYISKDKGNVEDFGGCMEVEFITEWMKEKGYYNE